MSVVAPPISIKINGFTTANLLSIKGRVLFTIYGVE